MTSETLPEWQPVPQHINVPKPIEKPLEEKEAEKPAQRGYVVNGEDPRYYEGITSKIKGDGE